MLRRRHRLVGPLVALPLLLAAVACGVGDDDAVTIFGPQTGRELRQLRQVMDRFTRDTGITVEVEGSRDFEDEVEGRIDAGDPPDVAMFPQPGRLRELADDLAPLSGDALELTDRNFDADLTELVRFDGELWAVPVKADLKSLIWYSPEDFREHGYTIPETFDELLTLAERMRLDGNPPFCVGIEDGEASGWPMTDWIEDFLLRMEGPEVFEDWVNHDIAFDDPRVVRVAETVVGLWNQREPDFVYGGTTAAAVTNYKDAGRPVLKGECMMHRQANFYTAEWPDGTDFGPRGDVDAFRLPGSAAHPDVALSGGLYAAAFSHDPDVAAVMEFLASTDFADGMVAQPAGGFLSPNKNVDVSRYPDELAETLGETLRDAQPVHFDASDRMPGVVGSGTFWTAAVDITAGKDVSEAFAEVESSWPEDEGH